MVGGHDYVCSLLSNPHSGLPSPLEAGRTELVKGDYLYYHYGCDGFDDRGWGCGYRTLMTLASWIRGQKAQSSDNTLASLAPVPSNHKVQEILVQIQDKPSSFTGTKEWIGCIETGLVLDELYGVPCRILHSPSGSKLQEHVSALLQHFTSFGSPVMMGGDQDNLSKGIMGVCHGDGGTYLLVVDPHFWGEARDPSSLQASGWVSWKALKDFSEESFYNLCVPQLPFVISTL